MLILFFATPEHQILIWIGAILGGIVGAACGGWVGLFIGLILGGFVGIISPFVFSIVFLFFLIQALREVVEINKEASEISLPQDRLKYYNNQISSVKAKVLHKKNAVLPLTIEKVYEMTDAEIERTYLSIGSNTRKE